jgi:hypothetical protein
MLRRVVITVMIEAVSAFETSVNFYQTTRRDIPEDGHLHTRRRENLKSHSGFYYCNKHSYFDSSVVYYAPYIHYETSCQVKSRRN